MRHRLPLAIGLLLTAACPAGFQDLCDNGACEGDASTVDTGVDAPPGCDLAKDPKDSPACVDDSIGIFVDNTNGLDTNAGTKAAPVKSISIALSKTTPQKVRVYICEGTYTEDLLLDSNHDGISIFGGWKCGDWSYSGARVSIGKSTNSATLTGLNRPVVLEDLHFTAAAGSAAGESSVGMFVANATNVTLARVTVEAGPGKDAAAGTLVTFTLPAQTKLNGNSADGGAQGAANTYTCPAGDTTTGGAGGFSGASGDAGAPSYGDGGAGGILGQPCGSGGGGGNGLAGPVGTDGPAPTALGVLDQVGWHPSAGAAGKSGKCGQGGGGGQGSGMNGGGGGGAGGCGGAGGGGGGGGGASIALAIIGSTVTLTESKLIAQTAGIGGTGASGQAGENFSGYGGIPGNGAFPGCPGGAGGPGGNGGAGAGGAGGISVGVLWKGTQPNIDSATTSATTIASSGGTKGTGGNPGSNDGIDGVAQPVLQAP